MIGEDFPDEDFDTLAGLVISLLGRIPDETNFRKSLSAICA